MRELVLLRGLPASGKSSFVEEHGLGAYTLSLDDFRIKVNSVELTRDGGYTISQVTNTLVYKQFMSVVISAYGAWRVYCCRRLPCKQEERKECVRVSRAV